MIYKQRRVERNDLDFWYVFDAPACLKCVKLRWINLGKKLLFCLCLSTLLNQSRTNRMLCLVRLNHVNQCWISQRLSEKRYTPSMKLYIFFVLYLLILADKSTFHHVSWNVQLLLIVSTKHCVSPSSERKKNAIQISVVGFIHSITWWLCESIQ